MRGIERAAVVAALIVAPAVAPRVCAADPGHGIAPGALGVGARGSFVSVEGSSTAAFGLHLGYFAGIPGAVLEARVATEYARVSDLDRVDVGGSVRALRRVARSSAHPFVGVSAGVRQEWVGSFSQSRYPVGVDAGVAALFSTTAYLDVAYEYRRVLGDPVSDFDEHRVVFALAILFRNRAQERDE